MVQKINLNIFSKPDDPVLTKRADEVNSEEINSSDIKEYLDEMYRVALGEQKDGEKPLLVGLAAPQIGISKRIILVDIAADGKGKVGDLRIYINPEITWQSEEQNEWYEGCFSTSRVCGIVSRPTKIRIKAYTKTGEQVEEEYSGYTARILQHEIDHLNGHVFPEHITNDQNLHWVEEEEFPFYRNNEGWRTWQKKCSREKWEKIKGIKQ